MEPSRVIDPFKKLVVAINAENIKDVKHWLRSCDNVGRRSNNESSLTVFGHAVASVPRCRQFSRELLERLFSRPEFDVNRLEHNVDGVGPVLLLDLAVSAVNMEAVGRLCCSQDIDLTNQAEAASKALFIYASGGQDGNVIRHILSKSHEAFTPTEFSALLNALDESGRSVLHYASWQGRQDIVAHLLKQCSHSIDVNACGEQGFTALHLAAWNNCPAVVSLLLAHRDTNPQVRSTSRLASIASTLKWADSRSQAHNLRGIRLDDDPPFASPVTPAHLDGIRPEPTTDSRFLYPEMYNRGSTALHWAVWAGHVGIVQLFVRGLPSQIRMKTLNAVDDQKMTPLHYGVIRGDAAIVEKLLASSTVSGILKESRKSYTPLDTAYILILEAQGRPDVVQEYTLMVYMLLQRPDVKARSEDKDRQVFVDAADAILVGAALIASISFAGWLQPPLGYQQYYESKNALGGVAPPGTYEAYAAVWQHRSLQVFWIFNSLSFCCSIATLITGAGAVLPSDAIVGRAEVDHIRILLIRASAMLSASVYFVLGAFLAAGFACLPPELKYQWGMIATSMAGGTMCLIVLCSYHRRMWRLFRFENFRSGFTQDHAVPFGIKQKVQIVFGVLLDDSRSHRWSFQRADKKIV